MLARHQYLKPQITNLQNLLCLVQRSRSGWFSRRGRIPVCRTISQRTDDNSNNRHGSSVAEGSPSRRPSSPADNLNERQRDAALTTSQVARVKAGPGSGKTRVVVARTHHLITLCGVDPRRILAITFTNKAAKELRERLEAALGGGAGPGSSSQPAGSEPTHRRHQPPPSTASGPAAPAASPPQQRRIPGQVLAKTFHGLGSYILRRSLKLAPGLVSELGLDAEFKVLDADQSKRVLKEAVQKVEMSEAEEGGDSGMQSALTARELLSLVDILAGMFSGAKTDLAAEGHHEVETAMVAGPSAVRARVRRIQGGGGGGGRGAVPALAARLTPTAVQSYFSAYHRQLRRNNAVDFADLICLPVGLLDRSPELRGSWQGAFDHILVDEFQDTDPAQYKLVRLLLAPSASLFVVGDPDQAIYTWRGAEVGNMRSYLLRDFPSATTHHLSINYRSVPEIVTAADCILQYGDGGPPELYEGRQVAARAVPGPMSWNLDPAAAEAASDAAADAAAYAISNRVYSRPEEEAQGVAWTIVNWWKGRTAGGGGGGRALRGLDRIAVLYRRRDQSRPIEEALTVLGVPYIVVGGQPFWEYKDIADAVAYLHVVRDPLRSDVLLERIINEPKRGLGGSTVDSLKAVARAAGVTLGGLLFGDCCSDGDGDGGGGGGDGDTSSPRRAASSPMAAGGGEGGGGREEAVAYAPGIPAGSPLASVKLKKPALKGILELRGMVCRTRSLAASGASVEQMVGAVLGLSGYVAVLRELSGGGEDKGGGREATAASRKRKDAAEEAEERLERLQSLRELAARPDAWLAAGGEDADGPGAGDPRVTQLPPQPAVGLLGLSRFLEHAALVTGADTDPKDERPAVRLMTLHASKGLEFQWVFILGLEDGLLPSHRADDKDEERRLFYVGVTRAEDRLFLSRCQARFHYDGWKQSQPSPFLRTFGS